MTTIRRHRSDPQLSAATLALAFITVLALTLVACGGRTVRTTAPDPAAVNIAQLWQEPADLESRDLFAGPGGATAPQPSTKFTFVEVDRSGYSRGYDVRDESGMVWSVKLGREAQPEVVSSRILWAIGFHQMPTYYVTSWTMTGGPEGAPGPGRFRPELPDRKTAGDWSWRENEFVQTQPFKGLIVANVLLNNWDWKESNNKVYEVTQGDGPVVRQYVVRDLGASLGKTSSPPILRWFGSRLAQGTRNSLEDFESQGFIKGVAGERVEFDYSGIYGDIVRTVTARDVVWTSQLLSRLSDKQWHDALRAGGYTADQAARYVAKLKAKVAEGLALASGT